MNGWQRLWAVVCFLLAGVAVALGLTQIMGGSSVVGPREVAVYLGSIWLGVCVGMYVLGWLVAWVIRGFRPKQT